MQTQEVQPGSQLLFTVNETVQLLRLSRPFVYRLIQRGELASIKVCGSRRITWDAMREFVARQVAMQADK
ncbi:MAG: helix-turn-helix domain-containing protein [Ktedonobacteraceae bacterium]|nr:helix-turn-helix domain-containing protein [Ktedonobacteraceae bacterium]MBA3825997.1 helix-turn-helix domain-containing protein [Ktedonobacterales bacterium]